MSIDAMKQALEALEETESALARCVGPHKAEEGDRHRALAKSRAAITALRLAIEQDERQEPYAWEFAGTIFHDKDEVFGWWNSDKDVSDTPPLALYTAPPQRQPLTDEEIKVVIRAGEYDSMEEFARAIERAHGIGGGE